MASHTLALAKASLAAALMRPDPVPVTRDQLGQVHSLIDTALAQCSPSNVQRCREWTLDYAFTSPSRIASYTKYLVALSSSFGNAQNGSAPETAPKGRRKQLHILYLLSDTFHTLKFHRREPPPDQFWHDMQPHLTMLFSNAASYDESLFPRQHEKLRMLLKEWSSREYLDLDFTNGLGKAIESAKSGDPVADQSKEAVDSRNTASAAKEEPFLIPAFHGNPDDPYYELPAGNMLPHIVPNSSMPISSDKMKALQLAAGPASADMERAVKKLLGEANYIYQASLNPREGTLQEFDELGQTVLKDELTGQLISTESYYGWSAKFCEKMRQASHPHDGPDRGRDRSRSISRSRSRSSSYNPERRKRRYSSSSDEGSRRRPAFSDANSGSRAGFNPTFTHGSGRAHRDSKTRSRSRSHSPDARNAPSFPPPPMQSLPPPLPSGAPPNPPLSLLDIFPNGIPLGPDGKPLPPPRPPNYNGPWPPPLPPPPPHQAPPPPPFHRHQ